MLSTTMVATLVQSLSEVQLMAIDLHKRGLNVLPIPRPFEVNASGGDPMSKPPYIAEPFYFSRMHLCGEGCRDRKARTGHSCLPPEMTFETLFAQANIAVMTGRTSGNLLDIDCDSINSFEAVLDGLTSRKLPYWAFSTHRGGGVLLRLPEGEAMNKPISILKDVQIWGNRHFCVLPPSVHPAGTFYSWITADPSAELPLCQSVPEVSVSALDWLGVELSRKKKLPWVEIDLNGLPSWCGQLSLNNRRILVTTFQEGTRNIELLKPTYDIASLINAGIISYAEGESVLIKAAKMSNYPPQQIRRMLSSALKKDPEPARSGGRYMPKTWQKAQVFAQTFDWSGCFARMALTARAVFEVCVERSRMDQNEIFRATEREVQELANFKTRQRAGRGIDSLIDKGLLRKVGKEKGGSNLYAFGDDVVRIKGGSLDTTITTIVVNSGITTAPPLNEEQDVFISLGQVASRIWHHLLISPEPSLKAIARATNLPLSSVRYAIKKKLLPNHLVIKSGAEGLYIAEPRSGDEFLKLAARLGTLGYSERRKRENIDEREKWVNRRIAHARCRWKLRCLQNQEGPRDSTPNRDPDNGIRLH